MNNLIYKLTYRWINYKITKYEEWKQFELIISSILCYLMINNFKMISDNLRL